MTVVGSDPEHESESGKDGTGARLAGHVFAAREHLLNPPLTDVRAAMGSSSATANATLIRLERQGHAR